MGISLPFESGVNQYVTPELAFMFHYFFTRKFWMVYNTQALVCCPGGVGTCDELFEFLTLKQTGKLPGDLPVVLFGKAFWSSIVNWEVSCFIYYMYVILLYRMLLFCIGTCKLWCSCKERC